MNDGSFSIVLDFLITVCGGYVIWQYIQMKRTGKLSPGPLMPKDLDVSKCTDVQGYIREMAGKQLAFGIVVLLCGAAGLIQDFSGFYNTVSVAVIVVVFLAMCIWYSVAQKKAIRKYW